MSHFVEIQMLVAVADDVVVSLETAVTTTLAHQNQIEPVELTVLLTDDEHIQQLNRDFRHIDAPTDVLSFTNGDDPLMMPPDAPRYLGDIAISVPYAQRQADKAGHNLSGELVLLTIHGTLHLLGHDHEVAADKERMWAAQTAVLQQLNLGHIAPTES